MNLSLCFQILSSRLRFSQTMANVSLPNSNCKFSLESQSEHGEHQFVFWLQNITFVLLLPEHGEGEFATFQSERGERESASQRQSFTFGIFSTLRHLVLFSLNHHCRCQTQTSHVFLYRLSIHRRLSQTFRILVYSRPTHIWLVFVRAPVRPLSRFNPPSGRRTPHKLSHRLLMHF